MPHLVKPGPDANSIGHKETRGDFNMDDIRPGQYDPKLLAKDVAVETEVVERNVEPTLLRDRVAPVCAGVIFQVRCGEHGGGGKRERARE
jgi:hypothetical protein